MLSQSSMQKLPKKLRYLQQRSRQKLAHAIEDFGRTIKYTTESQVIVNQKELRILGLRRSGNHAIVNWIGKQIEGSAVFINHVRPLENPYRNQYENQLNPRHSPPPKDWKYRELDWWKSEKNGKFSFKDGLIYSYEDQELEKVAHPAFERKHDLYLGKSKEKFDVIIMRDPFNLLASRLQTNPREDGVNYSMLEVYSRHHSLPELWISYAKECLGETSYLKNKKVYINYNKWFIDIDYRKNIAKQLNIEFSDRGFNDVSQSGRGSSFDGLKYAGETHKMDVLNRWKIFSDHALYRQLLKTDGLLEYSMKLFGHIPGTEVLLDK